MQALATRQQSLFAAKSAPASRGRRRPRPSDADLAALYHQSWMQPSPARPLPAVRAALRRDAAVVSPYATDDCRDPLAVQAAARPAWREAWAQVHAAERHRHHRVVAHARRPQVRRGQSAVLAEGANGPAETACCGHNACRPQPALNPPAAGMLETLLHALLECPAVRPALLWVGRLWVRVDGGNLPPLTPAVWIQGIGATWHPQASQLAALWHTLRIAALSAVWGLRDRRVAETTQFSPADVAESFVRDLRRVLRSESDEARASSDVTRIPGAHSSCFQLVAGKQLASTSPPLRPSGVPTTSSPALAARRAASPPCGCGCRRRRLATSHRPASPHTPYSSLGAFSSSHTA